MYDLPTTVEIGSVEYPIRNDGDYRMVLDCFIMLQDPELKDETERLLATLMIFYGDINSVDEVLGLSEDEVYARLHAMFDFFNCGQSENENNKSDYKLIDWKEDEQLIIAAINNVAGKEVRAEPYIHWWTFIGYYMSIGEGAFATIVSIRYKIIKGKKLEKHEQEFKRENPQYFNWNRKTIEQQDAEQYIRKLWNNGGKED